MSRQKQIRKRGKLSLSSYFKELKQGDKVAIVEDYTLPAYFPKRIQGLCGTVVGKRGKCYVVRLNQGNKEKEFTTEAAHLKKLKK
ncbi:MAG: 50S ribosomal protein L21e [archaeon]